MESEMSEIQNQMHLYSQVGRWAKGKDTAYREEELKQRLDDTIQENRQLRLTVAEGQTSNALLRSEMSQIRQQYEEKCYELHKERETVMECMHQCDHAHRQLQLLQEANKLLQDSNDSLREVANGIRNSPNNWRASSPKCRSHSRPASDERDASSALEMCPPLCKHRRSRSPSEVGGSDSPHSLFCEDINKPPDFKNGGSCRIRKFIEDIAVVDHKMDTDGNTSIHEEIMDYECNDVRRTSKELQRISLMTCDSISLDSDLVNVCEANGPPERTFKVVFAGDANVGKTCFIHRICKGVFCNNLASTLGVDFKVKTLLVDDHNVAVQLWDTAGQERFHSLTKTYFRRADGVVLMYDITNENSLLNVREWVLNIETTSEKHIPLVLCANKVDLVDDGHQSRCLSRTDGERLARQHGAIFMETSAKTGKNMLQTLLLLTREMTKYEDVEVQSSVLQISTSDAHTKKSNCCSSGKK